jgi:hypothetical protein
MYTSDNYTQNTCYCRNRFIVNSVISGPNVLQKWLQLQLLGLRAGSPAVPSYNPSYNPYTRKFIIFSVRTCSKSRQLLNYAVLGKLTLYVKLTSWKPGLSDMVARFYVIQHTKVGKYISNGRTIYQMGLHRIINGRRMHQMTVEYTKWSYKEYTKWPYIECTQRP